MSMAMLWVGTYGLKDNCLRRPAYAKYETGAACMALEPGHCGWVKHKRRAEALEEFSGAADGWLAAYAVVTGSILVTHEQSAPNSRSHVKLPDICGAFDIPYVNTFGMLRKLGIRLCHMWCRLLRTTHYGCWPDHAQFLDWTTVRETDFYTILRTLFILHYLLAVWSGIHEPDVFVVHAYVKG